MLAEAAFASVAAVAVVVFVGAVVVVVAVDAAVLLVGVVVDVSVDVGGSVTIWLAVLSCINRQETHMMTTITVYTHHLFFVFGAILLRNEVIVEMKNCQLKSERFIFSSAHHM